MDDHERGLLETTLESFTPRIARGMEEGLGKKRVIEDRERLSELGRAWVQGYLAARLSGLRGNATGNPHLSTDDFDELDELIGRHEAGITAELYA